MKRFYFILMTLFTGILFFSCSNEKKEMKDQKTTQVRQIPMQDFFKNPEQSDFKISPNGTYYSFLAPYEGILNIFVKKIGTDSVIQVTKQTDRNLTSYEWANDKRILFLKDNGGDENFRLYGVNIDGSNMKCLTEYPNVRTEVIDYLKDLGTHVIVGMNKRDPKVFDPYRIDIETGEAVLLAENPGNITAWHTDHEGKLRLAISTDGVNTSIMYRPDEKAKFKKVMETNFKDELRPLFFTFDNKNIYALSNINRDKFEVVIFDIQNGNELEVVYKTDKADVAGLNYSGKRKVLTSAYYVFDKKYSHFFDKGTEEVFNKLQKKIGEYEISVNSKTKDEDKFIIKASSDRMQGKYYFYDAKADKLEEIHQVANWLKEEELAQMKPISYVSRDGLTINGYLTLPVGVEAKNLPIIINPHGGPWARDFWQFKAEIQFLANRGYAVLQINYRGSVGFGKDFWQKSFKQWGKNMQNDISDAVAWAIKEGIADPKRVAIYGGSYGGYATLAGMTFTPELYACGIDYCGVSNIFTFYSSIPDYWEAYRSMLYEMAGDPVKDSLMLREVSPLFHVEKIKSPMLIAQGANDPRVKKAESDQMVEALKKAGLKVTYIVKDDEGHGFKNEKNKFALYEEMEKFLAENLKKK